jgi:hypothetical protein
MTGHWHTHSSVVCKGFDPARAEITIRELPPTALRHGWCPSGSGLGGTTAAQDTGTFGNTTDFQEALPVNGPVTSKSGKREMPPSWVQPTTA